MYFLLNMGIFHCYVSLPEGRWSYKFTYNWQAPTVKRLQFVLAVLQKVNDLDSRWGLNSHYFHIIMDGHQPNSRGLYTHYKDSLLKVG